MTKKQKRKLKKKLRANWLKQAGYKLDDNYDGKKRITIYYGYNTTK